MAMTLMTACTRRCCCSAGAAGCLVYNGIMSRHPIGRAPHHSHEAGDAWSGHALRTLPPLPSKHKSCSPRNLKATCSSEPGPRACYPASCLQRVSAYLYLDHHSPVPSAQVPVLAITDIPSFGAHPPLAPGHLPSQRCPRPAPSCLCHSPIRSSNANLTLFVSLVLDQRSHRQAICFLGYHDDRLPSVWPSYPLKVS
jgi:hypothetical protein